MSRAVNPVELRTCFSGIELPSDSARNSRSVVTLLQQAGVRLGAAKRLGGAGGLKPGGSNTCRSGAEGGAGICSLFVVGHPASLGITAGGHI